MYKIIFLFFITTFILMGCDEDSIPKPKAYLSLEYPKQKYISLPIERPYTFNIATNTIIQPLPQKWIKIKYPKLHASVDITYRPIHNNLRELLIEAEKLVLEHTLKADHISWRDFSNENHRVYGKMSEIQGNAASQIQFHATDSTQHFIKGSLFFYVKPNYDSILPAVEYIKKDMVKMMETLVWQKK